MSDDNGFLAAIQADPADDVTRLIYADWLDERGDIRGVYLRVVAEVANRLRRGDGWDELRPRLRELAEVIPSDWRELAGMRFDAVLESFRPARVINMIKTVRYCTNLGVGLKEAKDLVEAVPVTIKCRILLEQAEQIKQGLEFGTWYEEKEPLPHGQPRCHVAIRESKYGSDTMV